MNLAHLSVLALLLLPAASARAAGEARAQLAAVESGSVIAAHAPGESAYAYGRGAFNEGAAPAVSAAASGNVPTGPANAFIDPGPSARHEDKAAVPPPGDGKEQKGMLGSAWDWVKENKRGLFAGAALGALFGAAAGAANAGVIGSMAASGAAMGALGGLAAVYFFSKGNYLGAAATLGGTVAGFALGGPVGALLGGALGAGIGWLLG